MTIAITYHELKDMNPCSERFAFAKKKLGGPRKWNGNKIDAAQARKAGCTFDDIIWVASHLARSDKEVERKLRLWMADCAARVLHIYEKTGTSDAPRKAIIAARQYANGGISAAAWDAAWDAAWAAARAAALAAARAAAMAAAWGADRDADRAAALAADRDAAMAAAWGADRDADRAAAWGAAGGAARDAEKQWQFDRLIEWLSDDEPEEWPLPEQKSEAA